MYLQHYTLCNNKQLSASYMFWHKFSTFDKLNFQHDFFFSILYCSCLLIMAPWSWIVWMEKSLSRYIETFSIFFFLIFRNFYGIQNTNEHFGVCVIYVLIKSSLIAQYSQRTSTGLVIMTSFTFGSEWRPSGYDHTL